MFAQRKSRSAISSARKPTQAYLHTVHALLRERVFEGKLQAQGKERNFRFVPKRASVVNNRLVLSGSFELESPAGARFAHQVEARLLATQGAVGISPVRRQLPTGTAQTGQIATSDEKLEQERGPETELQPGLHAFDSPKRDELGRPMVESTGTLSFVGVLYLQLSGLDGSALVLPLKENRLQLNCRLAPTDDIARALQLLISDVVIALDEKQPDNEAAQASLVNINEILHSTD